MDMICSFLAVNSIDKVKSVSGAKIVFKDGTEIDTAYWVPNETRFEEEMVRNILYNLLRVIAKARSDIHGTSFEEELDSLTPRFKLTYQRGDKIKDMPLDRYELRNPATKSEKPDQ